jgi:hypothetical protein
MDIEKWLIIPLLYCLPCGVFYLAFTSPEYKPAAIQFASVAFGASLAVLGSKFAANSYKKGIGSRPISPSPINPISLAEMQATIDKKSTK